MNYSLSISFQRVFLLIFFVISFTLLVTHSAYAVYCRRDTDCTSGQYCTSTNQCASLPASPTPLPSITTMPTPPPGCYYGYPPCATGFTCDPLLICSTPTTVRVPSVTPTPTTSETLRCSTAADCPTPPPGQSFLCVNNTCQHAPRYTCMLGPQGDANCDNKFDLLDFNIWRTEFLAFNDAGPTPLPPKADFNKDGTVNLLDFNIWRGSFLVPPEPTIVNSENNSLTPSPISGPQTCSYKKIDCINGQTYCLGVIYCGVCDRNGGVNICVPTASNISTTPVIVR